MQILRAETVAQVFSLCLGKFENQAQKTPQLIKQCQLRPGRALQEVARAALRLYEVHLAGASQMRLQDDIHMHPYTHIAAIILVAIKLLFCLDAEASEDSNAEAQASIDWQAWAEAVVKASRGPVSFPTSAAAVHRPSYALLLKI